MTTLTIRALRLCLPACLLAAGAALSGCTDEEPAGAAEAVPDVEAALPTAEDVEEIEQAAEQAAQEITEENADATLEELEAAIGGEGDE